MSKVLLVEDDRSLSIGLIYMLEKENHRVIHCETVETALRSIENNNFDIAILDINLPDGESYELVKPLRERRDTPIIFLTAKDTDEDILKGFDLGADDYVAKPFSISILNARIKRNLEKFSEIKKNKRICGDLIVDASTLSVFRNGKNLDLTHSEYKLINMFLDNAKKPISREKILDFLWDSKSNYQSYSNITVYINRLREKIEKDPSNPKYLKTKRGEGYIWDVEVD